MIDEGLLEAVPNPASKRSPLLTPTDEGRERIEQIRPGQTAFSQRLIETFGRAEFEDLIAAGIDYCAVAAPTAFHEEIALRLAEAGVHALIEKPLAHDVDSATRIMHAFDAAGLVGAVGHIERYNPALQSARKRLEDGSGARVAKKSGAVFS